MLNITIALLLQVVPSQRDTTADSTRARRAQTLEAVQVSAVRGRGAAISEKTIVRADLQRGYAGQETPLLLQRAPGITAYSESGSASNYSYIRLRGIDQTRINITLDGIPLNEPEDQALFFSNFPDFANSIASVQVQRGVGSSTHGVASYAGSVNFESVPIAGVTRGGEVQLSGGSYGTARGSLVLQSGLRHDGFAGYLRTSAQRTDGYRFNSGSRSRSAFASGGWFGVRDVVKVSLLAGLSSNEQAYLASPFSVLRGERRDNPYGNAASDAVTDRFHQDLLSVAWTRALTAAASIATTVYGFDAGGWYEVPGAAGVADAYQYNLRSRWGGVISAFDWQGDRSSLSVGLNVARYLRSHWLLQRPALDARSYDNAGHKGEQSLFAKGTHTVGRTTFSGDVQLRAVQFRYEPTTGSGVGPARAAWTFLNPKVGLTVPLVGGALFYASIGANGREPTRADMFAGADEVDSVTARTVLPLTRVRSESVVNLETGATWQRDGLSAQANLFIMRFRNEIAPIGAINEIGYLLRKNVDRTMRRGVEADAAWRITPWITAIANVSMTDARIDEYRDDATATTYRDVVPLMTPRLVSNYGIHSSLARWLTLDVDGRYVSRMMLTNTDDERFVVPASWYADVGATVSRGHASVLVQVRNLFDRDVYTGGYPGSSASSSDPSVLEPYYYPLASRNVSVTGRLSF